MNSDDYLRIIIKRKWQIILVFVSVFMVIAIGTLIQTPIYRATAKIQIGAKNARAGSSLSVAQDIQITYIRQDLPKVISALPFKKLEGKPLTLTKLNKALSFNGIRDTQLIEINVDSTEPEKAALIANRIAEYYEEKNLKEDDEGMKRWREYLEKQKVAMEEELNMAEGPLRKSVMPATNVRTIKIAEQAYMKYLQQIQNLRLSEATRVEGLRPDSAKIIERAMLPSGPFKPNRRVNFLFGILLGGVLGIGLAYFLEYFDDSVKDVEEVKTVLNTGLLGLIPEKKLCRGIKAFCEKPSEHDFLVMKGQPNSPAAEAYRALRTNLCFLDLEAPLKSLVVTSCKDGEGKSTTASNLAVCQANIGKSVIVVDADMRKPVIHKIFQTGNKPGLSDIILGDASLESALTETEFPGLRVLPSGSIPDNPAELLLSEKMFGLMRQLEGLADFIIYDTPPLISVTDAVILSARVSGVIMVVDSRSSSKDLAQCGQIIICGKTNLLGFVLQRVMPGRAGSRYHSYHYHDKNLEQ
ncbi:MAG: polysaccharide biosynthesis tyrosine autokinase [bacterium]